MRKKPTVLMVLDGFGINERHDGNAVYMAKTPVLDKIMTEYPCVKGYASGLDVGLPEGQMGNSEVGHLNIGAGRIVYQELTRITKSIKDRDFFENKELLKAMENCKKHNSKLHLYGLLSDGGVHSHNEHLYALLELAKLQGLTQDQVFVHAFLDGRDTPPTSGKDYVEQLEERMRELGMGRVATVMGRYYAMDRDNRWERVQKAYEAMVLSKGNQSDSAAGCIQKSYEEDITDEFVMPTVITEGGKPIASIEENDSIICYNFRPDRAREITRTFVDEKFDGFQRAKGFFRVQYVCFTQYDITMPNVDVAYKPDSLTNTFGEYISDKGLKQLRLAETEKYAHVTFFFNGGVEKANPGEDRVLIPSPKVATYDLQPEMSAIEVTDVLVDSIKAQAYDVIIINYANPDMVGHTGVIPAAIKAIETLDGCLGRVLDALIEVDGQMFLCADHGNADQMINYDTNEPFTAHTVNPVPFVLINYKPGVTLAQNGRLADIAPTLLDMMDIEKPAEMTGSSLLKDK